jgi:hypothetical protein
MLGYIYVFATWRPVRRYLISARKEHPVLSTVFVCLIGAAAFGGAYWLLSPYPKDARLEFSATVYSAQHLPGTVMAGIHWSTRFAELQISALNPTTNDYSDLDFVILPDEPIAEIGQITALPDVTFTLAADMTMRQELRTPAGVGTVNPLVLIGTTAGYRVRCKTLPAKSRLGILLAVATVIDTPKGPVVPRPDGGIFRRDYVLRVKMSDGTIFWYGHGQDANGRIEDVYAHAPRPPKKVKVDGKYVASEQTVKISETFPR